jgi:TPP-dependent indolepyruvate ferredoxin oxidoreductase alpha subunit
MPYASKNNPVSFLATEFTAVVFKTTSQKGFHPRPAVVLFSRVCSTRTARRMYRCEQEKVCQTLENKITCTECHRCRLEKNQL